MPIITDPCQWVVDRLRARRPFFSMRYNDGEHILMFRVKPDGFLAGDATHLHHRHGDEIRQVLVEMSKSNPDDLLLGCSWHTDREDALNNRFEALIGELGMTDFNWTGGHWPLDGVPGGNTRRMLEETPLNTCLVTNGSLLAAAKCMSAGHIEVPASDSWAAVSETERTCRWLLKVFPQTVFVWAAGHGLKPVAWQLWKEFPQSSHVDVGHLFDGCFGLKNRGWLERGDGPWYKPYMEEFAPWVRSFVPYVPSQS